MAFEPDKITLEHVEAAITKIEQERIQLNPSTRYLVKIGGKNYPPKEVMRYAHEQMNGGKLWEYTGGDPTNQFLEKFGYQVFKMDEDPILEILKQYKSLIRENRLKDEKYKWELLREYKGRLNITADDLLAEIKAVNYANLVYPIAKAVMQHLATDKPEELRKELSVLFNEDLPIEERVESFNANTKAIYRSIGETKQHHQDERSIATYLTYKYPKKYTFYKNQFYKAYCKRLGVKPAGKDKKYIHYLSLIDRLVEDYISKDAELLTLVGEYLGDLMDEGSLGLIAQDMLYQMFNKTADHKKKYWRIGTKDSEQSYWDLMLDSGIACIGWSDLGDLYDLEINSRDQIVEGLRECGYPYNNQVLSRKSGEIFDFYNLKEGDILLAQDGSNVLGIGVVNDEYRYTSGDGFAHQIGVDWKVINPDLTNNQGLQTTLYPLSGDDLISKITNLLNGSLMEADGSNANEELNQILYGPPGTGKTYHTINKAISIIEGEEYLENKDRKDIKGRFDELVKYGQIVFTTFHQSMSYEDFIEGLKPLKPTQESRQIMYDVLPGIFRKICNEAEVALKGVDVPKQEKLYTDFIESIRDRIDNEQPVVFKSRSETDVIIHSISTNDSLYASPNIEDDSALRNYLVSKDKLLKLDAHFDSVDDIKNVVEDIRAVIKGVGHTYYYAVLKEFKLFRQKFSGAGDIKKSEVSAISNYVLIIDEINRGNISQIFGELITLIEESKRQGTDEALEVTLPYSNDPFSVPPNLYIIGTMNTADRSVEALDVALRRRFHFENMPPDPSLLSPGRMLWELYWNYKDDEWKGSAYEKVEQSYYELLRGITEPRKAGESNLNAEKLVQLDKDKDKIWGSWSNEKRESQFNDFEKYGLIGLDELLGVINSRITHLLDEDHQIGHSYFMSVHSLQDLATSFNKNIIPLLKEYFYNDYGKIRMILGDEFVKRVDVQPKMAVSDSDDFISTVTYQFQEVTKDNIGQLINAALGG